MGADDVSRKKAARQAKERERDNLAGRGVWVADTEGGGVLPSGLGYSSLEAVVGWASSRGDGWLRIVPALSGEVHWKWRFTSGRWAGHYVYWRQDQYETATSAFEGLAGKLDLVDQGTLKPSWDAW